MKRRTFLLAGAAVTAGSGAVWAQNAVHHAPLPMAPPSPAPFSQLQGGGMVHDLTHDQEAQRFIDSPAPLPIPRSEMAWATALDGRIHIVAGYGEGRVDRTYHHVYDPAQDRWYNAAPLPRGANHVSVAADSGRVYALGGFIEQNRNPDNNAYFYEVASDRWVKIAPLTRPRGAGATAVVGGKVHLIGGGSAPSTERSSVGWHEVYDPQTDQWTQRKAMPGARDHAGSVVYNGAIHIIGGRFNTFEYNTSLHHVYFPERDTWEERAPLPTARSGHGTVLYRNRLFAMGGEGSFLQQGRTIARVFGQMESYDPAADTWQQHAPMTTPRHSVGAVAIGDWIYVAGGGAVLGGGLQSSIHEAFTLG